MSAPVPGYDRYQCRNYHNCGNIVRNANTYCDTCTARGYRSAREHEHSGLTSAALGVSMALAEYGIPSGIQNFSFEADYYGCINGCGNKVRVTNTMCDKCQVGGGVIYNSPGLAHEALGLAEFGTLPAIQGISDHGSASYPCKNPSCHNKVQERGDLCSTCLGPDSNGHEHSRRL